MLPKLLASSAQERGAFRNIQKNKKKQTQPEDKYILVVENFRK